MRSGIRAQELHGRAVAAVGAGSARVEWRQLLAQFCFFFCWQVPATDFVRMLRATGVHHQGAVGGECLLDR
ncbi:MAG TPA: hypothetical protein VHE78_07770 [Gemmatimonadaceae bacterium]|nr:hypothetical protein [Gemmatimonadaceae bacterium]